MKNYRKLEIWETPFDGDIVISKKSVYNSRENVFCNLKKAYRAKNVRNATFSGLLESYTGEIRHICLVNNANIVSVYRKV